LLLSKHPNVHFLLAGNQIDEENTVLCQERNKLNIANRIHLVGERTDIPRLMAALDILVSSSSYGEGFPNVVGEAMSCGVPCVVTDVGDSAWIVGESGLIVPPRDLAALAGAMQTLVDAGMDRRSEMGRCARQRVERFYSIDSIIQQYEELYCRALDQNVGIA
jgi:glycosyltransferase involved in cell wall biosynthesis